MIRRWLAGLAGGVVLAGAATAHAALPPGAERAISELNRERAAAGLPATVALDPALAADCAAHDRYMAIHGLTHSEAPGSRGYTAGGAYAGVNSVLAAGVGWATGDPYLDAPLHLDQLLAPRLVRAGSADLDGYSCTTTFPGWTGPSPAAPVAYTMPGDGARGVAPSEVMREQPFTPGDLIGLRQPSRSGPVLIVLADAPGQPPADDPATLSGATLTGPSGPVRVRTVDGRTPVPGGGTLARYIAPGGFIVPLSPLRPGTTYRARVRVGFAGTELPLTWSFTTGGAAPASSLGLSGDALGFRSASPAAATVRFSRTAGGSAPAVQLRPGQSVVLHLAPGRWRACGRQPATADFAGWSGCVALNVLGVPVLRFGAPQVRGGHLRIPLRFSSVLRGRRATLTLTLLRGARVDLRHRRTVRITGALTLSLPLRREALVLTLSVPGFTTRDVTWSAVSASLSWLRA